MDLSKYLETMKNLPERFSNLAFWRGIRRLKDEMVKTFEYVCEWGTSVENEIDDLRNAPRLKISTLFSGGNTISVTINNIKLNDNLYSINANVKINKIPDVTPLFGILKLSVFINGEQFIFEFPYSIYEIVTNKPKNIPIVYLASAPNSTSTYIDGAWLYIYN